MKFDAVPASIRFNCNICKQPNELPAVKFHRELGQCKHCGSTPRFRGLMYGLSLALFKKYVALPDFPARKDILGVGISDWDGYAVPLANKFSFQNTYYHCEPQLDITDPASTAKISNLDFLICSDVLEHVLPPVVNPLANICKMLKPTGSLILTVPYCQRHGTLEHYKALHNYAVLDFRGRKIVVNERKDGGGLEVFDHAVLHGGDGTTLEMRLFSEGDLLKDLRAAGFESVKILSEPVAEVGYFWPDLPERMELNQYPLHGYVIVASRSK